MISNDFAHGRSILEGIADYADHHGRWQHHLQFEPRISLLGEAEFDGMIVEPVNWPMVEALQKIKTPTVTVGRQAVPGGPPSVLVDNRAVGRMAGEHLADLGLTDLAFVPSGRAIHSDHRFEGLEAICRAKHLRLSRYGGGPSEESLAKWLKTLPEKVGIFAVTDRLALSVARACRLAGRRIPEQVAVMGVDNETETCRLADPPLTSIDHGSRRIGYEAARLLDAWMTAGRRPENSVLVQPVCVVRRQSTDLLAIENVDVVEAIRFIRSRDVPSLKVGDVLKHVAISRRSLEMHFRKAIGRTIHEEINRVRMERAKQLLISTDWGMPVIAEACGFPFASQFSHAFKRAVGLPPLRYRMQFRHRSPGTP